MRKLYCTFLIFCAILIQAQDVSTSRISSYYTFIYKISNTEAEQLYGDPGLPVKASLFHTLFDYYPTDSAYKKKLPQGHFLFIKSVTDKLETELESVNNLDMHILNNNRDLLLLFLNNSGHEITNLIPRIRNRRIPYSNDLNAYRFPKTNKQGFVKVEYNGHTNIYPINRRYNNTLPARTKRIVLGTFPINHIFSVVKYPVQSIRGLIKYQRFNPPGIYYRIRRGFEGKYYGGYVALNKPKFKPNDTLKLKAFITDKKGKPVSKNLELFLNSYYGQFHKKIGTISPFRKGAYIYELTLSDSLKLSLDSEYSIGLNDKKGNIYPGAHFTFEQYELKQNIFSLAGAPSNIPERVPTIVMKGVDTNDMPLYDIRTEILLKPTLVKNFYQQRIFVADTLWRHELKLDALGDTRLTLPDSLFPNASLDYQIIVAFTNAENERQVKDIKLSYDKNSFLESQLKSDSLQIKSTDGEELKLLAFKSNRDTVTSKIIRTPYREKIEPFVREYHILRDEKIVKVINLYGEPDLLEVMAQRTKDSLFVVIQNARKIPFRFQLFRNNRIIEQGNDLVITRRLKTRVADRYYLSIQYLWAGETKQQNYDLQFPQKPLTIAVEHPSTVFPGQTAEFKLRVSDAFGKPVENTDLTAYAITRKFTDFSPPAIPNFDRFKNRKAFNEFYKGRQTQKHLSEKLDFQYWQNRLGLDSISYYHFLYPDKGIFLQCSDVEESITQVAPFVVKNGAIQPVYYIYFDRELKYYREIESIQPYSFSVNKKISEISIRLRDQLLILKNIPIQNGRKLLLSMDLDNLPDSILVSRQPLNLSDNEVRNIRPQVLWVSRDHTQSKAYFQQGEQFTALKPFQYGTKSEMVGPFSTGDVAFKSHFDLSFKFKSMMRYTFNPGLIDRESYMYSFSSYLSSYNFRPSVRDLVQTEKRINDYLNSFEEKPVYAFRKKYPDSYDVVKSPGKLAVRENYSHHKLRKIAAFVLNLNSPDEYFLFPPTQSEFSPLSAGLYEVAIIYNDQSYLRSGPIKVQSYGTTYYNLNNEELHPADEFSKEVVRKILQWSTESNYVEQQRKHEMQDIRQLYYRQASETVNFANGQWLSGIVNSAKDGSPLPGVNIIVKGTPIGTVSDVNGYYRLYAPVNSILVFSFIGLQTKEISTGSMAATDVQLVADVTQLNEVVVMGYSVQARSNLTSSFAYAEGKLAGMVAGVQIIGTSGASDSLAIRIRGATTTLLTNNPLVIIDGVLMQSSDIDYSKVTAIEVLKSERATALYGSRGANGVILISTRPGTTQAELLQTKLPENPQVLGMEGNAPGNSLRKNFRDYAFWKPTLITDKKGEVNFKAAFPDDLTGWNIHVLAMASKKRTGAAVSQIRSFKPLIAQLSIPSFLIEGDSTLGLGKITNYSSDSLDIKTSITIAGTLIEQNIIKIKNSVIDSVHLIAVGDSLAVQYQIDYNNYLDGELRKVPIFPKGVMEARGEFFRLPNDTTFTLTFNNPVNAVRIIAQSDPLEVLLDEIETVKFYRYECNEQLASKLKALLSEKTIRDFRKEKFEHDRLIEKLIKKLISNQGADGGWAWWPQGNSSLWITLHIAEALNLAEKALFKVTYDRIGLRMYLNDDLSSHSAEAQLQSLIFLSQMGERVTAKSITDTLTKQNKLYNSYYKLLAMRLLQINGVQPDWQWIKNQKRETLKGNWYWGEEKISLLNNDTENTLLVYQMLEHANANDPTLLRIRHYFLEKRNGFGRWRNTYESSRIIQILLPSLKSATHQIKSQILLTGDYNTTLTKFPFEQEIHNIQTLTISKTGSDPVYFSAYERTWNKEPSRVESDFVIHSRWQNDQLKLKAGQPITLEVSLEIKKDAEYVMINIPIPAGCSYESKSQNKANGEVHREYDIHETRIYCERLKAGKYLYSISLQPRYKGNYTLNPAKAEWMYFPVLYGRAEVNKVSID